jgi:uncharacterized protein
LAQNLPALSGRVVDQAELLPADQEAQITAKLEALERDTTRQLVVVTVPDLQGYAVEDFAFALGEQWKIGEKEADNGAILLVAPTERRVRIEVGDGVEGILPDAMAWFIIRDRITPSFKLNDYPGGIEAGVDGIIEQLRAPLEVAEERALQAARERQRVTQGRNTGGAGSGGGGGSIVPLIFWGLIIAFIILPALFGRRGRGRSYRRRRGGMGPVIIWGGGGGFGGGGGGWVVASRRRGGYGGGAVAAGGGGSFGGASLRGAGDGAAGPQSNPRGPGGGQRRRRRGGAGHAGRDRDGAPRPVPTAIVMLCCDMHCSHVAGAGVNCPASAKLD